MLLCATEGRSVHQGPAAGPLWEALHQPGSYRPLPGRRGEGSNTSWFWASLNTYQRTVCKVQDNTCIDEVSYHLTLQFLSVLWSTFVSFNSLFWFYRNVTVLVQSHRSIGNSLITCQVHKVTICQTEATKRNTNATLINDYYNYPENKHFRSVRASE